MPDVDVKIEGDLEPLLSSQGDKLRVRIKRTAADSQRLQGDRPPVIMWDQRIPVGELRAYATGLRDLAAQIEKYAEGRVLNSRPKRR